MCFLCHQNISDDIVKQQIIESMENPRFERWNSTSINHLMISLMGFNGYEVSDLAAQLLKNYCAWGKENGLDFGEYVNMIDTLTSRLSEAKNEGALTRS